MHDYHIHQYVAPSPLPPIDDEYRASARETSGEWMHLIDPGLPEGAPAVSANAMGAWEVGPDGEFTGRYWVNPEFVPQPATAGTGFYASFELVVWRLVNGYLTVGEFAAAFAEAGLLIPGEPDAPLTPVPQSHSGRLTLGVYTSRPYCPRGQEHWRTVRGGEVIDAFGDRDDVVVVINPDGILGTEFTGTELARLWREQQDYLAWLAANPSAADPHVLGGPPPAEPAEESASATPETPAKEKISAREKWLLTADPEIREAVEKVEAWLAANLEDGGEGVRVDYDNVARVPEGWAVPYDTVRWLDHGDEGGQIFPPPTIHVRVPQGDLRHASSSPEGASYPVRNRHGDNWIECVDPELKESGIAYLGVSDHAVIGWLQMRPDRTYGDMRWNPKSEKGPIRRGLPPAENKLEQLLSFHYIEWLTREQFLVGLLTAELFIPLHWGTENVASGWTENPRRLLAYSSSRRLVPTGLSRWHKWLKIPVWGFIKEYPGVGLVINPGQFPTAEIDSDELADTLARYPWDHPVDKRIEIDPAIGPELSRAAERIQQRFGLPAPPPLPETEAEEARRNGFELTQEEHERHLLGRAWEIRNNVRSIWHLDSGDDDISDQQWPADLRANGLSATYDSQGRVRPRTATFGKYFRMDSKNPVVGWHRVVGAYVGFALGDALGTAVDGMSWQEIAERFGGAGIHDLSQFDHPGRISSLTQQLLFLTEGAIKGHPNREEALSLRLAIQNALFRWAYTQGVPWSSLGGRLDPSSTGPDGWLVRVPELHQRRSPQPGALDAIRALAENSRETPTAPPFPALLGGLVAAPAIGYGDITGAIAEVGHSDPLDLLAARTLSRLLRRLMANKPYVLPVFFSFQELYREDLRTPTTPEGEAFKTLLVAGLDAVQPKYYPKTLEEIFDLKKMHSIGTGDDSASIFTRALYSVGPREGYPDRVLRAAVNHSGRSALTAAVAGALVGARVGVPGLPQKWVEQLELRDLIENVASDAYWHFSERAPWRMKDYADEWRKRYPREVGTL